MALKSIHRDREMPDPISEYTSYWSPYEDDQSETRGGWDFVDIGLASQVDVLRFVPATPQPRDVERTNTEVYVRFTELRDEWQMATMMASSTHQKVTNVAYQQMIGLGPQVVPFMIDELRTRPQHYYWALAAIVGHDHGAGAETMGEAAQRWIDWFDRAR